MARHYSMDRRAYLRTVGAAGVTATLAGCTGGGEGTITPGTASGFPPFEYVEDGELVGFDIALVEEIVPRAGYELDDWVDIEFDSLIPSLTEGDIDLAAAAMTITEDRAQTIGFSDPYYRSDQAVLVQQDGIDPDGFEDLEGTTVGAQAGTTGEGIIEDDLIDPGIIPQDSYRAYDNYTLAVNDLENGNVDAVVIDLVVAETFAEGRPVEIGFVVEPGEEFGLGMRQDDDRVSDVNDALQAMRDDGTYDELVEEWLT